MGTEHKHRVDVFAADTHSHFCYTHSSSAAENSFRRQTAKNLGTSEVDIQIRDGVVAELENGFAEVECADVERKPVAGYYKSAERGAVVVHR